MLSVLPKPMLGSLSSQIGHQRLVEPLWSVCQPGSKWIARAIYITDRSLVEENRSPTDVSRHTVIYSTDFIG
ncbi:unnamed protein product [Protopolystoma xenopodis]|uniref:Uncharacterized protein n=1 Tax=Protopolystoma xenopodis TaxID=117903 RepID=A0A448XQH5_9PLAT|nr:unnamed protein product [Protopolystoma xenopodis]